MNDCCVCYEPTQNETRCHHVVCEQCLKRISRRGRYHCPMCRSLNIQVPKYNSRFIHVRMYLHSQRMFNVSRHNFRKFIFGRFYHQLLEQHISQKYFDRYNLMKYAQKVRMGDRFYNIEDLKPHDIEYMLFCELDGIISKRRADFVQSLISQALHSGNIVSQRRILGQNQSTL